MNVSNVCKDGDGEDWLRCDNCGQYFHASCLNVDSAEDLANYFVCPEGEGGGGGDFHKCENPGLTLTAHRHNIRCELFT